MTPITITFWWRSLCTVYIIYLSSEYIIFATTASLERTSQWITWHQHCNVLFACFINVLINVIYKWFTIHIYIYVLSVLITKNPPLKFWTSTIHGNKCSMSLCNQPSLHLQLHYRTSVQCHYVTNLHYTYSYTTVLSYNQHNQIIIITT